jgi:inhibitor of KinA sporulation pathway (predicted exonuclease)
MSTSANSNKSGLQSQLYKYIAILDFEATCDDRKEFGPFEIIELPTLLLNTCTLQIDAEFHAYVQPKLNPILTPFCTKLTGITQETVNKAKPFPEVWNEFNQFIKDNNLVTEQDSNANSVCFLTCGEWDFKTMLPMQFKNLGWSRDSIPPLVRQWINVKTTYVGFYKKKAGGMTGMLEGLKLTLDGRHHSGIDDCRNISKIVVKMLEDGAVFKPTGHLKP